MRNWCMEDGLLGLPGSISESGSEEKHTRKARERARLLLSEYAFGFKVYNEYPFFLLVTKYLSILILVPK